MGLIELILTIAFFGVLVWAILYLLPMPEPFRRAIIVVAVLGLAIYVLSAFNLFHFTDIKIGK